MDLGARKSGENLPEGPSCGPWRKEIRGKPAGGSRLWTLAQGKQPKPPGVFPQKNAKILVIKIFLLNLWLTLLQGMVSSNHFKALTLGALLLCGAAIASAQVLQDTTQTRQPLYQPLDSLFRPKLDTVVVERIPEGYVPQGQARTRIVYKDREVERMDTVYVDSTINRKDNFVWRKPVFMREFKNQEEYIVLAAPRANILAGGPIFNTGIEFPIDKHWSVGGDLYWPWFPRFGNMQNCFQFCAFDLEGKYWFNAQPTLQNTRLLGHAAGAYAAYGLYDFQKNGSGHQGRFMNVGVDYTWAMPIFNGRVQLEFSLGLGVIISWAQPYDTYGDNILYKRANVRERIMWFGPTRAQVALVIPIYLTRKQVDTISFWKYIVKKKPAEEMPVEE